MDAYSSLTLPPARHHHAAWRTGSVQAQIQGGVCSAPIHIQSLPFETSATIFQSVTPTVNTNLCRFDPTNRGYAYTVTAGTANKIMRAVVSWNSVGSGSLGLFTGTCGTASMTCIASQSLTAILSSPLLWEGEAGVEYTLVVAGDAFFGPSIDYSLAITVSAIVHAGALVLY